MDTIIGWIFLLIPAFIYIIPTMIAVNVKHKNQNAIILLNIFTGWTFIGWIGALIWSVMKK